MLCHPPRLAGKIDAKELMHGEAEVCLSAVSGKHVCRNVR
jgi:hypothetical protein